MARQNKRLDKIARERIDILMEQAEDTYSEDKKLAYRYADISRRIAMRNAIPLPTKWKRRICKGCGAFLKPGANCNVRTWGGALNILCLDCGKRVRIPFTREKSLLRHEKALIKGPKTDKI